MVGPYFILTFNQRAGVFYNLAIAPVRHPYRTGAMGLKGIELPLFTEMPRRGVLGNSVFTLAYRYPPADSVSEVGVVSDWDGE
jgi:hypothetical protein